MNQYRAVHPSYVALHGADPFDHEFGSPAEEADALRVLELVPRPYRVLADNYTVDGAPVAQGEVIEAAFPMEQEAALLAAGHLERVRRDAKPTEPASPKKAAAKRAANPKE